MAVAFPLCESHPGRSLGSHLEDVANRVRTTRPSDQILYWTALFHDLGKATHFFQTYLHGGDAPRDLRAHAQFGAMWLLSFLRQQRSDGTPVFIVDLALAHLFVRRHHGRLDDLSDSMADRDSSETQRLAKQLAAADVPGLSHWLELAAQCACLAPDPTQRLIPLSVELLRTFADEARQNVSELKTMARFQKALADFGVLIEADRDSAAGYQLGQFDTGPKFESQHVEQFRAAGEFGATSAVAVRLARESVFKAAVSKADALPVDCGHLWSLTVPTGAGKTLAAIGWAIKRREARLAAGRAMCPIIYALPFTSIIDQNVAVLRRLWPESSVSEDLIAVHHHLAELGDIAEAGEESLARSWVEGWRSDIVCTTFVQVVNALFHGTCADARRFSKLAGSILILDEVQAVPAELWPAIRVALQSLSTHFGTDILLVTATQPALFAESEKVEIAPASLPSDATQAFDRYDIETSLSEAMTLSNLAAQVREVVSNCDAGSCLIVLNTVQEALDLHSMLTASPELSSYKLFHLSTNLRPKDRRRILAEIMTCSVPHILVATQVVEAGVDLSFDVVFRALAPLDSIVQAAGRCNRHGTGRRGRVLVFRLDGNSDSLIYGDLHLDVARRLLLGVAGQSSLNRRSEMEVRSLVVEYFNELHRKIGKTRSKKILDAVRQLEFAALRGEGCNKDRDLKRVQLIEDLADRVPHFVETDESDFEVWQRFIKTHVLQDANRRRRELHRLRNDLGQRIVEVPRRIAADAPDPVYGFVHVPLANSTGCYDINTGWKR